MLGFEVMTLVNIKVMVIFVMEILDSVQNFQSDCDYMSLSETFIVELRLELSEM